MVRKKGFTLIEIMIVISIIGLLSIILIPKVAAIKVQSKNKNVSANVLLVRTYLENRSGKDGISYQVSINGSKTTEQALTTILSNMGTDMISNFTGSNALINPFNDSNSIIYSKGNINNKALSSVSSVMAYYCTGSLPSNNDAASNDSIFPKGSDLSGNVIIVVYSTGYVLYGIDDSGQIVNVYIIKFPPTPDSAQSVVTPGNGDDSGGDNGGSSNGSTVGDLFASNCLNILGDINDTSNNIQTGVGSNTKFTINGSANLQGNSADFKSNVIINKGILSILTGSSIYFENAGVGFTLNSSSAQIQSAGSITFGSNINVNSSKLSSIVTGNAGSMLFMNNSTNINIDSSSSAYILSNTGIQLYQNIGSTGSMTVIAKNNIETSNNSAKLNFTGTTYLKGANVSLQRTGSPIVLYNTYIQANTFDYSGATIQSQNLNINGTLKCNGWEPEFKYNLVTIAQPEPTAPTLLTAISSMTKFSTTPVYNNKYETKYYSDLPVHIIKDPDATTLKNALNPQSGEVSSNSYKLLVIDGDCDLNYMMNDNIFNNIIIYCTGKLIGETSLTNVTFNNSCIMAKGINMQPSNSFTITQPPDSAFTKDFKNEINDIITRIYNNKY